MGVGLFVYSKRSACLVLLLTVVVGTALEAAEAAELNDGTTITVSLEPGLNEIFDEGTRRLHEKSTWKLWQWPPEEKEFFDADSFRCLVVFFCPPAASRYLRIALTDKWGLI